MPFSGSGFEDTTLLVWTGNDSIKIHRDTTRAGGGPFGPSLSASVPGIEISTVPKPRAGRASSFKLAMSGIEKLVCYRQPDRQRRFDEARTRGGTQAMAPKDRNRISRRQQNWAKEVTSESFMRGRSIKQSWPSLRGTGGALGASGREGVREEVDTIMSANIPCAQVVGRQRGATPARSLFTDQQTGRTFFTKADLLAFRQQRDTRTVFSPPKPFSACPGQIYVRIQGKRL